jgi:hypothetical protein
MAPLLSLQPFNLLVHGFDDWISLHGLFFRGCEGITESVRRHPVQLFTRSEE